MASEKLIAILKDLKDSWESLHGIQSDWEYLLMDMDSKGDQRLPKHALDMMAKYTVLKLKEGKALVLKAIQKIEQEGDGQ